MRTLIWNKYLLLAAIIIFGGFLRFFKLSEYPVQLNHDEVSQLYDTVSIVQTGKDIYGNFLPLSFLSTGDYKPGHYIYISTISYLIFGDREITIRIPAAVFGTLTILAVFLFVNALTKNWQLAILSAVLISVTPSEVFYSRKSFENVISVSLNFFGLFCLLIGLNKNKSKLWGYMGAIFLALSMYIYTSYTIVVPALLVLFALVFKKNIISWRKQFLKILLVWFILVVPLIFLTVVNADLRFRAQSVFITQDVNLGRLITLSQNPLKSYIDFIFLKYLNQFDPIFLFANGLNFTNQGLLGIGPLLHWQFPFLVLGIIFLIIKKPFVTAGRFLFGLVAIAMFPSAVTFENYSPHRSMLSFAGLSIISAFGLYWSIKYIMINKKLRLLAFFIIFTALIVNLIYFIQMYTVSYPYEKSQNMHYPFKEIALYVWSEYQNFETIVFDPQFGDVAPEIGVGAPYYFAYYGHILPEKFQKEFRYGEKPREIIFDKFSIRQVYWLFDKDLKNTLIIASPWSVPEKDIVDKSKIIKRFYFYNGKLAFYAIKL